MTMAYIVLAKTVYSVNRVSYHAFVVVSVDVSKVPEVKSSPVGSPLLVALIPTVNVAVGVPIFLSRSLTLVIVCPIELVVNV